MLISRKFEKPSQGLCKSKRTKHHVMRQPTKSYKPIQFYACTKASFFVAAMLCVSCHCSFVCTSIYITHTTAHTNTHQQTSVNAHQCTNAHQPTPMHINTHQNTIVQKLTHTPLQFSTQINIQVDAYQCTDECTYLYTHQHTSR